MTTLVYQTHRTVCLRRVTFGAFKVYFNKPDIKKKHNIKHGSDKYSGKWQKYEFYINIIYLNVCYLY